MRDGSEGGGLREREGPHRGREVNVICKLVSIVGHG